MKVRSEVSVEVHCSASSVNIVGPLSSIVKSIGDLVGELTSGFHDVDLSRSSPSSVFVVSWKHPKSGPQVVSFGQLGSNFEFSVLPCDRLLGVDSSRSVFLVSIVFWLSFDEEESILYVNVVFSVGVALEFVVLRSAVVFIRPDGSIEFVSIEFVRPN